MIALPARLADIKAECALLSAAVAREDWLLEVVQNTSVDDYTRNETQAVYTVLSKMQDRGEKVTLETLFAHERELSEAGYIKGRDLTFTDLVGNPPLSTEFPAFMQLLKEMTARRHVLTAAQTAVNMINKGEMSDVAFAEIEKAVMERTATGMERQMLSPDDMADAIEAAVNERMDEKARNKHVIYSTFKQLNKFSGGLEKGDLIILSAESGAGKSAFSMNLADGIACNEKRPTLYLNSEMQTNQNALRWASYLSKVSHTALRNGSATEEQAKFAKGTSAIIRNSALWTLNMPDMQVSAVLAEVRRAKAQHDIEIAFVDYIGRMDTMNFKDAKEWQVMKSAAQRLKTLAVELQITVVMVAQLTSDGGRLAQSSYMSHEADLWLNISRIKEDELQRYWPWNYGLIFRKARNCEAGKTIFLRFNGDTLTFTDKESDAKKLAGEKPALAGATITKGGVPL